MAVQAIAGGWPDDPGTLPLLHDRATADPDEGVRETALEVLTLAWAGDPGTLPLMRELAADDPDRNLRRTAAEVVDWLTTAGRRSR